MSGLLLALLAAPAIGLHAGETKDVSYQDVLALMQALSDRTEMRTQRPVEIDSGDWEQCKADGPCVQAVRARTKADDVVLLQIIPGPTRYLVSGVRLRRGTAPVKATIEISKRGREVWADALGAFVATLFPEEVKAPPPPPPVEVQLQTPAEPSVAPWITAGVAVALMGVGVGFGVSNRLAKGDLEGRLLLMEEEDSLRTRMRTHGLAANVLFAAAGASAITALILWMLD